MSYWVLKKERYQSFISQEKDDIVLQNGLIKRVIDINRGVKSLVNIVTEKEFLDKECCDIFFTIDDREINFYKEFKFVGAKIGEIIPDVPFEGRAANMANDFVYPPKGKSIVLTYKNDDFEVKLRYEIFDNIPVISKKIILKNLTKKTIIINKFVLDKLLINEKNYSDFYGETSYNGGCMLNNNRQLSVQYNDNALLLTFDIGPDAQIKPNDSFESFVGYELVHTAKYYEHKCIEVKEMYRVVCPWVMDSPLIFHITSDNKFKVKKAINNVCEVGFDMLIQSFGSKVNCESQNKIYVEKHKKLYDYAHKKGIRIGAYTLAIVKNYRAIRGPEVNVYADPKTKIIRCLASEWSENYWQNIFDFYKKTNADAIEIDGPYHFTKCSGGHTHLHKGLSDSRYLQWKLSTVNVLKKFKQLGVYVNAPDWLFLSGSNKTGVGYEEIAFSEPRQAQLVSARIYNYKGTFGKIPSMAWGFVPLGQYHGGGKAAIFEPLKKNIKDYEWAIAQHFMAGVIPCFRGKKLFDSNDTKAVVQKWVAFYKKYKEVINGITVHFLPPIIDPDNANRATDIDAILNVLPYGEVRGVLGLFNQTDRQIVKEIHIPMYYTGLTDLQEIPSPHDGSGILDVSNPIYGLYPPLFPVKKGAGKTKKDDDLFNLATNPELAEERYYKMENGGNSGSVSIAKEGETPKIFSINANGDAVMTVTMQPMSFDWFEIRPSK